MLMNECKGVVSSINEDFALKKPCWRWDSNPRPFNSRCLDSVASLLTTEHFKTKYLFFSFFCLFGWRSIFLNLVKSSSVEIVVMEKLPLSVWGVSTQGWSDLFFFYNSLLFDLAVAANFSVRFTVVTHRKRSPTNRWAFSVPKLYKT